MSEQIMHTVCMVASQSCVHAHPPECARTLRDPVNLRQIGSGTNHGAGLRLTLALYPRGCELDRGNEGHNRERLDHHLK